eukprot:symbB.v1.2.016791.t1/scaffold1270.1/size227213/3
MVFGESMINDAVAIVVFEIMNSAEVFGDPCDHQTAQNVPLAIVLGICQKLIASVVLGCVSAVVLILLLRFASLKHSQLMEILYIMACAYLIYGLAETSHASGIIATLFGSMMMGIYAKPHLSSEGLLLATFFVKGMATLADTFTFLIVGIGAVAVSTEPRAFHFSLWVMLFCLAGRAACIMVCGLIANGSKVCIGKSRKTEVSEWLLLSWRHLFMMWHAGLRGAIALVLCWELGDWVDELEGAGTKETLVTSTLVVICVFLLTFGGTTQLMLHCLGIRTGEDAPEDYLSGHMLSCSKTCATILDKNCLWPCLVGDPSTKDESLAELTRHALHDLLHDAGMNHRSQAVYRRTPSLRTTFNCHESDNGDMCHLTISGIAYHTKRACDNCDRPIEDRMWFACAEGCEVDFCARCHTMLQQLFEGRDLERSLWTDSFTSQCAKAALRAPPTQRQAFIDILAFDWPLQMFQDLVRAVADVADAKVVHLQDGSDMDVAQDGDFWPGILDRK